MRRVWDIVEHANGTSLLHTLGTVPRCCFMTLRRRATEKSWRSSTETSISVLFKTHLLRSLDDQIDVVTMWSRSSLASWEFSSESWKIPIFSDLFEILHVVGRLLPSTESLYRIQVGWRIHRGARVERFIPTRQKKLTWKKEAVDVFEVIR